MAKLWKVIDGEPFLINPHLAIVGNPKKGRKHTMARRKRASTTGRKRSPARRRRRTYRRNPFTVPGVVIGNPKRRHRKARGFAMNRKHRRKSYRRNPAILGMQLPALQTIAYVGIGFVGTPILEGFLASFMPTTFATSTLGKYVIRIGSMLGITMAGRQLLGRQQGNLIAVGGGLYVATSLIKDFAPGMIPGIGAYVPGIAAYQTRLSAYQRRLSAMPNGLAAPAYGARNTTDSAANGGMNVIAQRFRRFQ
jgi:hypothetical protein